MFRQQLLIEFDKYFESKKSYTIAMDLKSHSILRVIYLKSASNLNGNLNCSKELEHYSS